MRFIRVIGVIGKAICSSVPAEVLQSRLRDRHVEVKSYSECVLLTLQSAAAELSKARSELDASKNERSSLQTKVVQLTTALKSILATKVSLYFSLFIAWFTYTFTSSGRTV